ncbi:MAG: FAD:protein FMN transferase, partial [Elusimicrobia bacterium]|nr:FAD:protein FMN transferase [Elusimicrobiota bacterium]
MRNKIVLISAPVLVLAVFIFSVVSFNSRRIYKNTEFLMDTYVTIQAVGKKAVVLKATKKAFKRMSEVDEKFNMLKSQSPIYAFNKKSIPLTDPEIIRLIKTALEVSNKTGGAFDVTIKPLIELWGFYSSNPPVPGKRIPGKKIPGKKDISEILKRVNYRRLVIKNGT